MRAKQIIVFGECCGEDVWDGMELMGMDIAGPTRVARAPPSGSEVKVASVDPAGNGTSQR
jgi:hypothetical protein